MTQLNSSLKEWGAVAAHAEELKDAHLRDLAAADPKRWQSFHVEHDTWLLDMSRQRITAKTLPLLFDLARAADLPADPWENRPATGCTFSGRFTRI